MSSSTTSTPEKIEPSELVVQFSELYRDTIVNAYDVKSSNFLGNVKRSLKDIRKLKYDLMQKHDVCFHENISYEKSAARCAYLYAYSILNTTIVYFELLKHLERNTEAFLNKFSQKTLKICCLAGGPGTEAVAITKAIRDFICKSSTDLFTDVQVTVVDIISQWKTEGEALINALNRSTRLFGSKKVNFQYSFLKADLFSPFEEVLKEKIAEADIVTVVKFGSAVEEISSTSYLSHLENTIKNAIDCMDEESCLFMLDLAGGNTFKQLALVISNQQNKFKLQKSLHKKYLLLPKTLQKMEAYINFQNFAEVSDLFPTKLTRISSCIWIKNSIVVEKKESKKSAEKKESKKSAEKKESKKSAEKKESKKSAKTKAKGAANVDV